MLSLDSSFTLISLGFTKLLSLIFVYQVPPITSLIHEEKIIAEKLSTIWKLLEQSLFTQTSAKFDFTT